MPAGTPQARSLSVSSRVVTIRPCPSLEPASLLLPSASQGAVVQGNATMLMLRGQVLPVLARHSRLGGADVLRWPQESKHSLYFVLVFSCGCTYSSSSAPLNMINIGTGSEVQALGGLPACWPYDFESRDAQAGTSVCIWWSQSTIILRMMCSSNMALILPGLRSGCDLLISPQGREGRCGLCRHHNQLSASQATRSPPRCIGSGTTTCCHQSSSRPFRQAGWLDICRPDHILSVDSGATAWG